MKPRKNESMKARENEEQGHNHRRPRDQISVGYDVDIAWRIDPYCVLYYAVCT